MGLRVVFMGTPEYALSALQAIDESAHKVIAVYTQPPRPKGRGQKLQKSPVHDYADIQGIPVFHPENLKNAEDQAQFSALNADVAVVAAYGLILPKVILESPKFGCINSHASLLPRWRGASPIQQAIWAGDAESGVTVMQMEEKLDTGPVLAHHALTLDPDVTATSLHNKLCEAQGGLLISVLDQLAAGKVPEATAQDDTQASYAPLLSKEDGRINWDQSATEIDRQIRALNPWPGVWSMITNQRIKILEGATSDQKSDGLPGTILDRDGYVSCGSGVLRISRLQPEGAKAMDFGAAVNGGYLKIGDVFS